MRFRLIWVALVPTMLLSLVMVLRGVEPAHARLGIEAHSGGVRIENQGNLPLMAVAVEGQRILYLEAGQGVWRTRLSLEHPITGRFRLMDWAQALGTLDVHAAPFHLGTAGVTPDAFNPGIPGQPSTSANAEALRDAPLSLWRDWARGPPLRMALVTHAARFGPVAVLDHLLQINHPQDALDQRGSLWAWPAGYESLDTVSGAIRYAIEHHGTEALEVLMMYPDWSADRGFGRPELALAFPEQRIQVRAALVRRTDPHAQEALALLQHPEPDLATISQTLTQAFEGGREEEAAAFAVRVAVAWGGPAPERSAALAVRLVCGGLDGGARRTIRNGQLLAARAYLTLEATLCGATRAYRGRVADFARASAEWARTGHGTTAMVEWFQGAHWFAHGAADRAQLADGLADLAVLHFRRAEVQSGDVLLGEARDYEPFRPKVIAAASLRPGIGIDPRARIAILIICLGLGFFSFRRLKRVFRRGPNEVRHVSLKGGPRTW